MGLATLFSVTDSGVKLIPMGIVISEEMIAEICRKFDLGTSKIEIAKDLGLHEHTIIRHLAVAGKIPPRRRTKGKRKYALNMPQDDKFLGYVCGLIASDGYLRNNSTFIQIVAHPDDSDHLRIISKALLGEDKVKFYGAANMCSVSYGMPELYDFCMDIGVTPNKSLTLDVDLSDQSDTFKWYFLRGAIDGDGCVQVVYRQGKNGHQGSQGRIEVCSASEKFIDTLVDLFEGRKYRSVVPDRPNDMFLCQWAGNKKVAHLLENLPYGTEDYFLKRKCDKIKEIVKGFKEQTPRGVSIAVCFRRIVDPADGQPYTATEFNKKYGKVVSDGCFIKRLDRGWEPVAAATTPPEPTKRSRPKDYKVIEPTSGKTYSLVDALDRYGVVTLGTARDRIGRGWDPYTAVITPPIKNSKPRA